MVEKRMSETKLADIEKEKLTVKNMHRGTIYWLNE
jgi:hypothetical protein